MDKGWGAVDDPTSSPGAAENKKSPIFGGDPAIVCMWRFSKSNGITEGFHRKMKLIQRRAYGFKNFENYRLRVIAECG